MGVENRFMRYVAVSKLSPKTLKASLTGISWIDKQLEDVDVFVPLHHFVVEFVKKMNKTLREERNGFREVNSKLIVTTNTFDLTIKLGFGKSDKKFRMCLRF